MHPFVGHGTNRAQMSPLNIGSSRLFRGPMNEDGQPRIGNHEGHRPVSSDSGLSHQWLVADVDLDKAGGRVDIHVDQGVSRKLYKRSRLMVQQKSSLTRLSGMLQQSKHLVAS